MIRGMLARKLGTARIFSEEGHSIPVTVVEAGPCTIIQKKTRKKDGYNAIQLGFMPQKESRLTKPEAGHFKKAGKGCYRYLREFSIDDEELESYEVGQEVTVENFEVGEKIDVVGISKGRGFAGVIKRHGFHGGKDTHGSMSHRVVGSIGASSFPSRVIKGKKMPGHMGNSRVTVKNLTILDVRPDENVLVLKGSVPGSKNGLLLIHKCL